MFQWPQWKKEKTTSAALLHQLIAALGLLAWFSLGLELEIIMGTNGLYPIKETLSLVQAEMSILNFPTHFWWDTDGQTLWLAFGLGCLGCLMAISGRFPRSGIALSTGLYLSFCTVGRDLFSFQWDSLMIEMGLLGCLIPAKASSQRRLWLPRLLLFKVMFFSGLAKWQSHLNDWHDGTAMQHYYETAPLPTWMGWYAHHLPKEWHIFESWWALFFELAVPFLLFGSLRWRRVAASIFGLFFIVDSATANYGFFVPQAAVLSILVSLPITLKSPEKNTSNYFDWAWISIFVIVSSIIGLNRFAGQHILEAELSSFSHFRLINPYHLFGHITRQRTEAIFTVKKGSQWQELQFHAKPGDPFSPPPFVTPRQPRVDFRLWFYGLSYNRGTPAYVESIVVKLCTQPQHLKGLFQTELSEFQAIQIRFWSYQYCTPQEHQKDGCWWKRELIDETETIGCKEIKEMTQ